MDDFILTFCQQWIHLYALPPDGVQQSLGDTPIELDPIAQHRWPYRIDTLIILARRPHPLLRQLRPSSTSPKSHPTPICVLLRFDSWFPWPVNILHHFILPPNPHFDPHTYTRVRPGTLEPPRELPYLRSSHPVPLKPYLVDSMPSPIRLFTPTDMVIGPYGTALWLDAQTDPIALSQAGDRGQRIAGKVLRWPPPPAEETNGPRHAVDLQVQLSEGDTNAGHGWKSGMVFHLREENEEWGRLAVCEDEGRIAVSCVDGRILVYDYT